MSPRSRRCEETGLPCPFRAGDMRRPGSLGSLGPVLCPSSFAPLRPGAGSRGRFGRGAAGPSPHPLPSWPGGLGLGVPVVQGPAPSAVIHGSPPCPPLAGPDPGHSRCPGVGGGRRRAETVQVRPGKEGTRHSGAFGGTLWGHCSHQALAWARGVWGQLMPPQPPHTKCVPLLAVRQPEQGEPCFVFPSARSEVEVQILQGGLCSVVGRFSSSMWP